MTAHEMEREEVTKTDEWKEFHDILIEKGDIPEQLLPALEVIFELKKMYQFSKEGTNFVISDGNPFLGETRWLR